MIAKDSPKIGGKAIWGLALACFAVGLLCFYWSRTQSLRVEQTISETTEKVAKIERKSPNEITAEIHLILWELAEELESRKYYLNLVEHISLALIVAGILLVTVELHTRKQLRREVDQYREEVATSVWRAISGRLLGESSLKELDSILKAAVVRKQAQYVVTLRPPYPRLPPGYIVLRRELWYRLHNLTGAEGYVHTIRMIIDSRFTNKQTEENGVEITLPRHVSLKVGQKEIPLKEALDPDDQRSLKWTINLPASAEEYIEVHSCIEEMVEQSDGFRSTGLSLTEGLTLSVVNEAPSLIRLKTARLHHPNWKDFKETVQNTWVFSGTLLPGQGFTAWWESKNARTNESTAS